MNLSNQTVIVTGAGGFIGGHLVEALHAMGCDVKALVSYNSAGNFGGIDSIFPAVRKDIEVFRGDIRDRGTVARAMADAKVVLHLAGLAEVPYSFEAPESYVATNILGTLNILEEARRMNYERVVVTSTAAVYGRPEYLPVDEKHPCRANSPYSATKISAERLAESYFRSYDLQVSTVRPFNTYGPRQSTRAIIPSMISQLLTGADELKVGDLDPTRDMVFVRDTVRAFIEVAQAGDAAGHEINIATGREVAIRDIVENLVALINPSAQIVVDPSRVRNATGGEDRIFGCNSKLKNLTGWAPQTGLEEGLQETIKWFKQQP